MAGGGQVAGAASEQLEGGSVAVDGLVDGEDGGRVTGDRDVGVQIGSDTVGELGVYEVDWQVGKPEARLKRFDPVSTNGGINFPLPLGPPL